MLIFQSVHYLCLPAWCFPCFAWAYGKKQVGSIYCHTCHIWKLHREHTPGIINPPNDSGIPNHKLLIGGHFGYVGFGYVGKSWKILVFTAEPSKNESVVFVDDFFRKGGVNPVWGAECECI